MFGHLVWHFELSDNFPFFLWAEKISTFMPGKGVVIFFVISGFFGIQSVSNAVKMYSEGGGIGKRSFCEFILNYGLH